MVLFQKLVGRNLLSTTVLNLLHGLYLIATNTPRPCSVALPETLLVQTTARACRYRAAMSRTKGSTILYVSTQTTMCQHKQYTECKMPPLILKTGPTFMLRFCSSFLNGWCVTTNTASGEKSSMLTPSTGRVVCSREKGYCSSLL